ncbi:MAG: hypothetical protein ACREUX_13780 [Burkholderiales bacterium]
MPHLIEPATSGRSGCRGCGRRIGRGELRFGERLPNPFAESEMTLWFHPACAACKRPAPLLETLAQAPANVPDRERLERTARRTLAHHRLARIDGAERAPGGQASCRACREAITHGSWRIRLVFFEEGRFSPGGFVHLDCRKAYFETDDVLEHLLQFGSSLEDGEREALRLACEGQA